MEIISGLINNNQKVQSAEEVIPTLCDRLQHSRLASDRRAAILALKGFSRQYRESVVANGLRGLISTLVEFSMDTEILKACLETLLILFIRGEGDDDLTRDWISQQSRIQNGKYPSPLLMKEESNSIDQFSLWIADEVTQDDKNIGILISLLENNDFYVRLYTLQFLEALVSTRPLKTKESILQSPLGISSLVQVLGDSHDPIRNETVLLLMAIANDNFNIQKLIAFESTFDRLFEIIHEEGDIRGSIVVQDCLTLISNLLKYNISNQKLFLETNCLPKLSFLISEPLGEEAIVWNDQRLQNIIICLEIVSLFVIQGNESTKYNQDALFKADIFLFILQLAFSENTPNSIRPTALITVASLINENKDIQSNFGSLDVPYIDPSLPIQIQRFNGTIPVVTALLNWCLYLNSVHVFDIRVAAETLLESYFNGNEENKMEFIQNQIKHYTTGEIEGEIISEPIVEEPKLESPVNGEIDGQVPKAPSALLKSPPIANIFTALLEYDPDIKLNPYKIWFSSVILIKLINENEELKSIVTAVTSGDEEADEDVITAIQSITGLLVSTLSTQDQRISIGYLMLLIVWLYEDFEAVNDFLSESSNVKALLSYLAQVSNENVIIQGLVSILLGIAFDFSSKDSPLSRVDLHSLIVKMLGKDNYSFKLLQFKEAPAFADFSEDDIYNPKRDETGLPNVFLDSVVVNLIKENFYRFKNTLHQDPTSESNGRISYEKFEQLQESHHSLKKEYEEYQSKSKSSEGESKDLLEKTTAELAEIKKTYDKAAAELSDLKANQEELKSKHDSLSTELERLKKEHIVLSDSSSKQQRSLESSSESLNAKVLEISKLKQELENIKKQKITAEDGINKMSRELMQLTRSKDTLEAKVKSLEKDVQKHVKESQKLEKNLKQKSDEVVDLKSKLDNLTKESKALLSAKSSLEKQISELSNKAGENSRLIEQLTEKLRSLANSFNDLTAEKTELESKLSSVTAEFSTQVNQLKGNVSNLEVTNKDLSSLSDKLGREKDELTNLLKSTKDNYELKLKNLQDEFKQLQTKHVTASSDLEASKSLSLKYEKEIIQKDTAIKEHTTHVTNLKDQHSKELENQKKSYSSELEKLKDIASTEKKRLESALSTLKEKLSGVEGDKKNLETSFTSNTNKIDKMKRDLNDKEEIIQDLTRQSDKLVSEISDLSAVKDELNRSLKNLEKEVEIKDQAAIDVNSKLVTLESAKDELEKKLKQMEIKHKERESDITKKLETELDELAVEFETKESELKKSVASLTESNKFVTEEKKSLESTLQMISQTMDQKEKEFEILSKDFKVKNTELGKIKDELITLENSKARLSKSLDGSKDEVTNLKKEVKSLESKIISSEKEIKKKSQSIDASEQKLKDQKSKYEGVVKDLELQIESLKTTFENKSTEFEKERSLLSENSSSSIKEYSEKVTKLEDEIKQAEKKAGIQILVLEKQKTKLEEKITELEDQKNGLSDDLSVKEDKISALENTLQETKDELTDTKSQISKLTNIEELHNSLKKERDALLIDLERKENSHKELVTKLDSSSSKSTAAVEKLRSEISDLEKKLSVSEIAANESTKENSSLLKKIKTLETKLTEIETSSTVSLKAKESEIDTIKKLLADKDSKLAKSEKDLAKQMKEAGELRTSKSKLEELLQSSESLSSKKIEELNSKFEELIVEKNGLEKEVKSLTEADSKNERLEAELSSVRTENDLLVDRLKKELEIAKAEKDSLNTKLQELDGVKAERDSLSSIKEENEKIMKELVDLKKTHVPKSELDDMMLVLDDLDEKKNSYKEKLKALGGEISSDEDDDDDDEDDDEDDED